MSTEIYTVLVVILAIGLGWWWVYLKPTPTIDFSSKGRWTYRVRGVPRAWDQAKLVAFLAEQDDSTVPAVHSLAAEVHGRSQTATVSFRGLPRQLRLSPAGGPWTIPLPEPSDQPGESPSLTLDDDFLGVTTLYVPPPDDYKVNLVAISGLGGHAFGSFKERGGEHMWLRDALPHHITGNGEGNPIARVMLYGYDSSLPQSTSFQNLDDIGMSFLDSLLVLASTSTFRPIVILAHSLGGLVVKQSIISLSKAKGEDHQRLFRAVYGIVFFGVPHLGMDISSLKPMAGDGPNRALLESIGTNAQLLSQQFEDFQAALGRQGDIEVLWFYETLQSPTAIQDKNGNWKLNGPGAILVSPQSATHCRSWEDEPGYRCPINRTHSGMVKFRNQDEEYEKVVERIKGVVRRANSSAAGVVRPNLSNKERNCLRSLAYAQMDTRANDVESSATGTCEWLLQHRSYKTWANSNRGMLWIKGKPGSGKSTLLKYALGYHEAASAPRSNDLILSFFFHGRGSELQKTPLGLFRHILYQLLGQVPGQLSKLVDEFQRRHEQRDMPGEQQQWQWHPEELWHFVKSSLPKILEKHPVWLFVDALDECGEKNAKHLVEKFKSLLESLASESITLKHCRVIFSCRHYPILDGDCELQICPEHENAEDISAYIRARFIASRRLTSSTIASLITERASGVFMWARLVVDQALDLDASGAGLQRIAKAINSIPEELDNLYQELVQKMDEKTMSLKLIQWICFAERPLSPDELRWALIVDTKCGYQSLQQYQSHDDYDCDIEKRLKTLSRGLAEVTPSSSDSRVVQFIHQSVKDFFASRGLLLLDRSIASPELAMGMAHIRLSGICIQYLAMEEIDASAIYNLKRFPFLHYATTSWVAHTRKSDASVVPQDDLVNLFTWPSNSLLQGWIRLHVGIMTITGHPQPSPAQGTKLVHVLSRHGITRLLGFILPMTDQMEDQMADINAKDSLNETPLLIATIHRQETTATLLVDRGAKLDVKGSEGLTPLLIAVKDGNEAIATLLVDRGAKLDMKDNEGRTPLLIAIRQGHEAIARLLLDRGAKIDFGDMDGGTPLCWAAKYGQEAIVRLLLDRGADVNVKGIRGRTPLLLAAHHGHEAAARLLLDQGAEVNAKDNWGRTPLSVAAAYGHEAAVGLLLNRGAEVHAKDNEGQTPLSFAAMYGYKAIVRLLLARRVEVHVKDSDGRVHY